MSEWQCSLGFLIPCEGGNVSWLNRLAPTFLRSCRTMNASIGKDKKEPQQNEQNFGPTSKLSGKASPILNLTISSRHICTRPPGLHTKPVVNPLSLFTRVDGSNKEEVKQIRPQPIPPQTLLMRAQRRTQQRTVKADRANSRSGNYSVFSRPLKRRTLRILRTRI